MGVDDVENAGQDKLSLPQGPTEEETKQFDTLWLEVLSDEVQKYIRRHCPLGDEQEDLLLETYLRLRESVARRRRMDQNAHEMKAYAVTTAKRLFLNRLEERYPGRRRLRQRVVGLLNQEPRFARWKLEAIWLCGLRAWLGRQMDVPREEGRAFLAGDYTDFRRNGLESQEPTEIVGSRLRALDALLDRVFAWVASPFRVSQLIYHLSHLLHVDENAPLSLEEMVEEKNPAEIVDPDTDLVRVLVAASEDKRFATEVLPAIRELLCRDGVLTRCERGALLFKWDKTFFLDELGLLASDIADAFSIPYERFFQEIWPQIPEDLSNAERGEKPLSDDRIAEILGIHPTLPTTPRSRISNCRMVARERKMLRWCRQLGLLLAKPS